MQRRPKGVPPRAQQSFQYFVYPELSSSSSGSETSIASSDDGSGVGFSSTTFKASADCAADVHTRDGEAGISGDGGGDAERGESAACAGELPANTPALVEKAGGRDYSVDADGGVALSPRSPPLPLESPREREGHQQQEAQERPLQDLEGLEQQRQGVHEHPETTKEEDPCSWTECSVCLEAFSGGDSACRTPCGHIFHAEVRRAVASRFRNKAKETVTRPVVGRSTAPLGFPRRLCRMIGCHEITVRQFKLSTPAIDFAHLSTTPRGTIPFARARELSLSENRRPKATIA